MWSDEFYNQGLFKELRGYISNTEFLCDTISTLNEIFYWNMQSSWRNKCPLKPKIDAANTLDVWYMGVCLCMLNFLSFFLIKWPILVWLSFNHKTSLYASFFQDTRHNTPRKRELPVSVVTSLDKQTHLNSKSPSAFTI